MIRGKKIEQSNSDLSFNTVKRNFVCRNKHACYQSFLWLIWLLLPGLAGLLLNSIYYFPVSRWVYYKTKENIFYDALLCGLLTITYPLYILLAALLLNYITPISFWLWLLIFPFTGWCAVRLYASFFAITNYLRLSEGERKWISALSKQNKT